MRLTEVLSSYPSSHIIVWAHRRGKILVKIYRLAAWLLFSVMHSSLAYTTLYRQPSFLCSLIKKKCQKVTTSQLKSASWQNNNRSTEIWPIFTYFLLFSLQKNMSGMQMSTRESCHLPGASDIGSRAAGLQTRIADIKSGYRTIGLCLGAARHLNIGKGITLRAPLTKILWQY